MHSIAESRLFIAIKVIPDAHFKRFLNELRAELRGEKMRFTPLENLHITLKFLGDTKTERIPEISRVLSDTTGRFPEFDYELRGLGIFRNLKTPRVLWTGLNPYEVFRELKVSLEGGLASIGFLRDEREFNPHLTLARMKWIKERDKVSEVLVENEDKLIMTAQGTKMILFESRLNPGGAVYEVIDESVFSGH